MEFSLPLPDGESIVDVLPVRVYPLLATGWRQSDEDVLFGVSQCAWFGVVGELFSWEDDD
ncbi:MAG: hypothetical protein ACLT90_17500 [Enterococcus raffinosus]